LGFHVVTALQAVITALIGCILVVTGIALLSGPAWALIGAGGMLTAVAALLFDKDAE
jgi:hypothetical protein